MTPQQPAGDPAAALAAWIDRESVAETMVPIIGGLYRRRNVVTTIHGRRMHNRSANQLLKLHRFARRGPSPARGRRSRDG